MSHRWTGARRSRESRTDRRAFNRTITYLTQNDNDPRVIAESPLFKPTAWEVAISLKRNYRAAA